MSEESQRFLHQALTRWNYFPNQKDGVKELPPLLSSQRFTPEIARIICSEVEKRGGGYGLVEYRSTRFNNVPRMLDIIHPKAYSDLVCVYDDNWHELEVVYANNNSVVRPDMHGDGRAFIMNYENYETKVGKSLDYGFSKRFRVHADIANCFGSIYTHAVEWATRGLAETKHNRGLKHKDKVYHWSESLDKALRSAKRDETQGVPIGPGTSSLAVELILGAVDSALLQKNYSYLRYVDDYTCLCRAHEEAQEFLRDLGNELSKFKLSLNLSKTAIVEQPEPLQPSWVSELMRAKPSVFIDDEYGARKLTLSEVIHYLDYAVRLNSSTPDGSVLKFALSSIIRHISPDDSVMVANYIANLAWHYPVLLPFLGELPKDDGFDNIEPIIDKLEEIIVENARHNRSDGMAWGLFFLMNRSVEISEKVISSVIQSRDCVSITLLTRMESARIAIKEFVEVVLSSPEYVKDEYWLLLFQLYIDGEIENPYEDETFVILKEHEVDFMPVENSLTKAEHYSVMLEIEGLAGPLGSYDEWRKS